MSEQTMPVNGAFCWNELGTTNIEAAKSFYSELLGWKLKGSDVGGMVYNEIHVDGRENGVGGMFQMGTEFGDTPSHWMPYVAVDDVDAKARQVAELGGKVCVPPSDIPNVGRFCIITDPTGATLSLIKLNPRAAS
ncbi:MAG TPA: VOC family protein [Pyrinomonadaceae bacterium]